MLIALAILFVLAVVIVLSNIFVVQQSRAYVIERLGAFHIVQGVGLHMKAPFIDRIARRVSLKEQVLDYPPQPAEWTRGVHARPSSAFPWSSGCPGEAECSSAPHG